MARGRSSAALTGYVKQKFGKRAREFGQLGDYNKTVKVPGSKNLYNVRVRGAVIRAWGYGIQPVYNLEVELEYKSNQVVITGLRARALELADAALDNGGSLVGAHAPTHTAGGVDPVYIYLSQIYNARLVMTAAFKYKIYAHSQLAASWASPQLLTEVDLTASVPGTGAKWCLVYVDYAGVYQTTLSAAASNIALLIPSLIPTPPFGSWPAWAIRLYAGQTEVSMQDDVKDLRWAATPFNAAQGPTAVTIASGAITAKSQYLTVTGEGSVTDDLATINGGAQGSIVTLRIAATTSPITVKHNTGNIILAGGADVLLSATSQALSLIYDATLTKWLSTGGAGAGAATGLHGLDLALISDGEIITDGGEIVWQS